MIRTITPTLDADDALAAGKEMQRMAALDRCGSPEVAALFSRVGAQLRSAAKAARAHVTQSDVSPAASAAARVIRGEELDDAAALALARLTLDTGASHATEQLAKALIRAHERTGSAGVDKVEQVTAETLTDGQICDLMARMQADKSSWTYEEAGLYDDCSAAVDVSRKFRGSRMRARARIAAAINARGARR